MENISDLPKTFSCEFFPPKTDKGLNNLLNSRDALQNEIRPEFYSVTFGAGGSTRETTLDIVQKLLVKTPHIAPHISCMGSTAQQIQTILDTYIQMGINRLVTLRGDIPDNNNDLGDFKHASELVEYIRKQTNDRFKIEVAAYPEYHPEASSPSVDLKNFKRKVDAGANSAITQYFYNTDAYYSFIDSCHKTGIDIPIVPGIMPITNYTSLARFSDNCGAEIPRWIRNRLQSYGDDLKSIQLFGVEVVTNLCSNLLDNDAPGLHFYTLNKSEATINIWNNLKL